MTVFTRVGMLPRQMVMQQQRRFASTACGIVGLPNIGKSTLFNALTKTQAAEASNFPFCTIEPNVALVSVPDERLNQLAVIGKSQRIIPSQIELYDIAGLVKGASEGQGLGNKFLGNIRSTSVLIHVVRCFDNTDVHHVNEVTDLDPVDDIETIETELVLSDMATVEKRLEQKKNKQTPEMTRVYQRVLDLLGNNQLVHSAIEQGDMFDEEEMKIVEELHLLTAKPILYLCNIDEDSVGQGRNALSDKVVAYVKETQRSKFEPVVICSKLEEDIAMLLENEAQHKELLEEFGLTESGLSKVMQSCYKLLGLQSFFTVGEQEARAWSIKVGATAKEAAGKIHTDIARGFITAETVHCDDYMEHQGIPGCKTNGKLRHEGKAYVCQDGDVFNFRFNVTTSPKK